MSSVKTKVLKDKVEQECVDRAAKYNCLPCPFCGDAPGASGFMFNIPRMKETLLIGCSVFCTGCICGTPRADTFEQAAEIWNTRKGSS